MPRYAVLLRGVNLGGHKKVSMADLRELLSGLGYRDVRTLLNSGNVVLAAEADPAAVEREVEGAIEGKLGMSVRCLARTGDELRAVIEGNPLAEVATNGSRMMVHFLFAAPDPALLSEHNPVDLAPTEIGLGDRVVYQWCPDGLMAAPPVGPFVEKHLGVTVTARNSNTVTKLRELST
ncbi:MAG: DUF1697 domain-containing protein [Streptosporangiales bacterium]|nr:DUF1697 domain-containing protein [Streptosporangiales bacterium]